MLRPRPSLEVMRGAYGRARSGIGRGIFTAIFGAGVAASWPTPQRSSGPVA